jgi:hypothetical protein
MVTTTGFQVGAQVVASSRGIALLVERVHVPGSFWKSLPTRRAATAFRRATLSHQASGR